MRLFNYTDHHVVNVLRELRVKVSRADELNDPFELSPTVPLTQFTLERTKRFLRTPTQIDDWYRKEGRAKGFTNIKRYKAWYLRNLDERAAKLLPNIPSNVEAARQSFAATFSSHWRLFFLSKRRDSVLMWSHYSKHHTGAVIEFDMEKSPFSLIGEKYILPVHYRADKAVFSYDPRNHVEFEEKIRTVARTKAIDWKYEDEVRLMIAVTACPQGKFFPITAPTIKSVTIGARTPASVRSGIFAALSDHRFAHVEVVQASLSKDHYQLEFQTIPRSP